jgi:hypothetical protein
MRLQLARLEPTPYCQYTSLKELEEGEEVDREVSFPILNIEENNQQDNLQGVNRELGNPPRFSGTWVTQGRILGRIPRESPVPLPYTLPS